MLISITGVDFVAVWATISASNRLFLVFFSGVSIHTVVLSVRVLLRLHVLNKQTAEENVGSTHSSLSTLTRRIRNLRQLHLFTLYLLGFCITVNIPYAFSVNGLYKTLPAGWFMEELGFLLYYYSLIFLGFLALHSVQWLVSARIDFVSCRRS